MSNNLDLKKGLNIPIKGVPAPEVVKTVKPDIIAIKPTDFAGLTPRLLVKEGDVVKAGSPVMTDKLRPEILLTSPVSGKVESIVRGEKRKLLAVLVKADAQQEYVDFGAQAPKTAQEVKELLLKSGLWVSLVQRPYGTVASPDAQPKAIFVSSFSTAPLAADTDFVLGSAVADIQAGVDALAKVAPVHFAVKKAGSAFAGIKNATVHSVSGPHPAGNVGVQISHIAPIQKGETVWTVSLLLLAAIGKLVNTGKLDLTRKVAITGPCAPKAAYVVALPGTPVKELTDLPAGDIRVVGGDALTGEVLGADGCLGFFQDQLTLLEEGTAREWFGWAKPFRPSVFSSSWCYFSWLTPKKEYKMDTNLHGGPRAFVETKCFEDVTPMDIFPIYLIKACLAGDIEKMEKFGIYEVLPEDLALCDYVDPSKNEIQAIIQKGIDLMIKEMA
ncbi:MAG: Na(+)-translocating NADH-quinone reductase subunit A [Bacteroidales bacterium]|nr:Na(+)-translocating NADH-quinone reductase subunit A [Bacteroidales bacterium]